MKKPARPTDPRPEWPEMLFGSESVRGLLPSLGRLPPLSDRPSRSLQTRDVFVAHLLAFFNPALRSLRTLEDFSRTRQARRRLAVERPPKSTLADSHRLVDPAVLEPIVAHLLQGTARRGLAAPADPPDSIRQVPAVDGAFLALAADVARAVRHRANAGQPKAGVRIDAHLDVASGSPRVVNAHGAGTSEPASATPAVVPGAAHVYDRGYFDFASIQRRLDLSTTVPTPFVMRMREPGERSPRFDRREGRSLSAKGHAAGMISDHVGRPAGSRRRTAPQGRLREVVIASPEEPGGVLRLLTNPLGGPAWVIGLLYRYRRRVEPFFRWLQATTHFRRPLSGRREAIAFEVHVAAAGTSLPALRRDARPSKYAFALLHRAAGGGATAAEILPILAERERRRALLGS